MYEDVQRYVLVAKLHSYLRDGPAAVRILSDGLERHPRSPHLYRHRGHLCIIIRDFAGAIDDFVRAITLLDPYDDEIEFYQRELVPEMERAVLGQPLQLLTRPTPITEETLADLRNVYKGTLVWSTWYHYGLARYLRGEFDLAADTYETTLGFCVDDDMRIATLDWWYMSLRRASRTEEAARLLAGIDLDAMHVVDPSYHRRMRMYRGELAADDLLGSASNETRAFATQGYGVGNWLYNDGKTAEAAAVFERVVELGQKEAFGRIAAEIDLAALAAEQSAR